ncbi:MAG: LysM peptidoglycan-binding domain-containing protein [Parachlamydiaceae bacterium]
MVDSLNPIRRLIVFLVISGSLNIVLIGLFFYWNIKESPPTPYFELKPAKFDEQKSPLAIDYSDSEVIRYFRRMPITWLVSRLNNTQLVENGYTQRDLALASLISFHNFDIDRALAGLPPPAQKRVINYGKFRDGTNAELIVYPGLSEKHFSALRTFAATERWPLTGKGVFFALQKEDKEQRDLSLVEAFLMTSDFNVVQMLFSRGGFPVDRDELLAVLLEGNWSQLAAFVQQQKISQDLSPARRQGFLLDYIQKKSATAARLMLKTDGTFAAKKLDDAQVLLLLQLIEQRSPESEQFALQILASPRSDDVRKMAAQRLYHYAGEPMPEAYQHQMAISRFVSRQVMAASQQPITQPDAVAISRPPPVPKIKPVAMPPPPKPQEPAKLKLSTPKLNQPTAARQVQPSPLPQRMTVYVVQEGDSLWKISRRLNVDVDVIRAYNELDSDLLSPGRTLKIPKK